MRWRAGFGPRATGCRPLVYTYVWQEDVAKIFKVPGALRNVNPARAIKW